MGIMRSMGSSNNLESWYDACAVVAERIAHEVPECYQSRTFTGIIGDIKALPPNKARSLFARKKGLGKQYAALYLSQGIDGGRGYQACASDAMGRILEDHRAELFGGPVLDVGCAVGVSAGVLGLDGVVGFDLFSELLDAARLVDSLQGKSNRYAVADMTHPWPFRRMFRAVICGLVCHHLKTQADILTFFSSAARVLEPGGSLVVTLPSGSVASAPFLRNLSRAIESFGFEADERNCGMVISGDDSHSLFWMFLLVFNRTGEGSPGMFVHPGFGFPEYRTPVTREEKGIQAKASGARVRAVRHTEFRLIGMNELSARFGDSPLTFSTLSTPITGTSD